MTAMGMGVGQLQGRNEKAPRLFNRTFQLRIVTDGGTVKWKDR